MPHSSSGFREYQFLIGFITVLIGLGLIGILSKDSYAELASRLKARFISYILLCNFFAFLTHHFFYNGSYIVNEGMQFVTVTSLILTLAYSIGLARGLSQEVNYVLWYWRVTMTLNAALACYYYAVLRH